MTFERQVRDFAEAVRDEAIELHQTIGRLSELTTDTKLSTVDAVNELNTRKADQSALTAEAQARQVAETALQAALDSESTVRRQADTALGNTIDAEAQARIEAVSALQDALSAKADKSTTYTKAEVDSALQGKSDSASLSDYYTKSQVDSALAGKADASGIPSKLSDLTNDAGYISSAALSGYVPTSRKVNGKALSADITLNASDVGALPSSTVIPTVPTKVSAFQNDAGYLTSHQDLSGYASTAAMNAALAGKADSSSVPTKTSDLTNDSGYITSAGLSSAVASVVSSQAVSNDMGELAVGMVVIASYSYGTVSTGTTQTIDRTTPVSGSDLTLREEGGYGGKSVYVSSSETTYTAEVTVTQKALPGSWRYIGALKTCRLGTATMVNDAPLGFTGYFQRIR